MATIRVEIQEHSAGTLPSVWQWTVFENEGGVERVMKSGKAKFYADASRTTADVVSNLKIGRPRG